MIDPTSLLGPLDPLFEDSVTDILLNGPDQIWICSEKGLRRVELRFRDDEEVRTIAVRIATLAGRPLDDAHPFVDVEYLGLRIHAILPPLVPTTHISIRRINHKRRSVRDLLGDTAAAADLLGIVHSHRNFLISGGTGAGKTTLLTAMLGEVSTHERIAVIEDTREINAGHSHVVSMQTRVANSEGKGEVSIRDLMRQALRMRPDRIFIGEVRGAEVVDLLAALNTGHPGSGGTLHANSAAEVPTRIESMALFAGIPGDGARRLFFSAIDVVIHLFAGTTRGIESISVTVESALIPLTRYSKAGDRM